MTFERPEPLAPAAGNEAACYRDGVIHVASAWARDTWTAAGGSYRVRMPGVALYRAGRRLSVVEALRDLGDE